MGAACTKLDEAGKIDKEINDLIRRDRRRLQEEVRLLLLGMFSNANPILIHLLRQFSTLSSLIVVTSPREFEAGTIPKLVHNHWT